MNMMLINDECFRNDMETFIDFYRELFVTVWKFGSQFFIGEPVFDNTGRKPIKICFPFSFRLGTTIGRDDDFFDLRFFRRILV